jgi:hypothetical protein
MRNKRSEKHEKRSENKIKHKKRSKIKKRVRKFKISEAQLAAVHQGVGAWCGDAENGPNMEQKYGQRKLEEGRWGILKTRSHL